MLVVQNWAMQAVYTHFMGTSSHDLIVCYYSKLQMVATHLQASSSDTMSSAQLMCNAVSIQAHNNIQTCISAATFLCKLFCARR